MVLLFCVDTSDALLAGSRGSGRTLFVPPPAVQRLHRNSLKGFSQEPAKIPPRFPADSSEINPPPRVGRLVGGWVGWLVNWWVVGWLIVLGWQAACLVGGLVVWWVVAWLAGG